ncbi:flavodoxin domain-containing protein [Thermococcus argininiproducens]|uniref:Flavodoxin domain-containing protein n=1 Tax=Thermococcus argininiproducens TaxID=2866384 RepID=A0A9E7SC83_9EURY|nr:flavodoxin domain-containing protein [Thermococcus argininiproducens]USG99081.1 flavodoxin domain-containing protein [Thermococcus argininiproducens]
MKICILYDTKRGSTKKVALKIGEALKEKADIKIERVTDKFKVENCDLIIIGAPIYYERPLPSVINFIRSKNGLEGKKVAVFVLCIADKFGEFGKKYTEKRYMRLMTNPIKGKIIAKKVFDGWILNENPKTLEDAKQWALRVLEAFQTGKIIEKVEHPE